KQDPLEEKNITINNNQKQEELHNTVKQYNSASHEFDNKLTIPPKNIEREIKIVESKPKLAIIIDDVSTKSHVKVIKSLNIPITMSFLPPSRARPHSAKLAAKEDFYMVHLPMEAKNFTAEEPLTLRVDDSQSKISSRIIELKKLFPKVQYINNHTGSKFTSDEKAMNRLIYSLNKNKINFIDSRTTAQTKAPQVLENFGKKYIARDIFLDHKNEKEYILAQIKRAIKIAKKHGSAIAIGHPHAKTMLALHHSKQLFKGIELVYIDKIE
ncbi:MAG: divergent polysaccharide deacetylase family protein, partial [Campylobacterota bacterium]|nr:divergent polysaccharide deacetylase family protein [Campylobacterota bacterium]